MPPSSPPAQAAPTPVPVQPAISTNIVPVVLLPAAEYRWIWEEPGAMRRYFRIGAGIVSWALLLVFSGVIAWVTALSFGSQWFQALHGASPANTPFGGLPTLAVLVFAVALQFVLIAISIGGICRLLRDALRD